MKNQKGLFWDIIKIIMALFMLYGGIQHFTNAAFFIPFVPEFLGFKMVIIYGSGLVEIIIGLLLIIRKLEGIGALALFILMLVFLPIHIWDVFSETPAIGSHQAALVRLPIQLILIGLSWKLKNIYSK